MRYLVIFRLAVPNEFVFPKREQLESTVSQRGWEPVHRETCIEAGLVTTAETHEELHQLFRRHLADGEAADIIRAPEFLSHDQLVQWAKARATGSA